MVLNLLPCIYINWQVRKILQIFLFFIICNCLFSTFYSINYRVNKWEVQVLIMLYYEKSDVKYLI